MDYQNEDYDLQQEGRMSETIPCAPGLIYKNYSLLSILYIKIISDTLVRIVLFYILLYYTSMYTNTLDKQLCHCICYFVL